MDPNQHSSIRWNRIQQNSIVIQSMHNAFIVSGHSGPRSRYTFLVYKTSQLQSWNQWGQTDIDWQTDVIIILWPIVIFISKVELELSSKGPYLECEPRSMAKMEDPLPLKVTIMKNNYESNLERTNHWSLQWINMIFRIKMHKFMSTFWYYSSKIKAQCSTGQDSTVTFISSKT